MKLVENCILMTTKKNDLIYDCYMGSGTTAKAAIKLNRKYIGSDLNLEYINKHNLEEKNIKSQIKLF